MKSKKVSRQLIASICLGLLLVAIPASAEQTRALMFEPNLLLNTYSVQFEQALSDNISLTIDANYLKWSEGSWDTTGFGGGIGFKRYFLGSAPKGPWMGGTVGIISTTTPETTVSFIKGTIYHATALTGYKWITTGGFTLELAAGEDLSVGILNREYNTQSLPPFLGRFYFGPTASLKLGYSF